jgi:hypothetical protein
MFRYILFIFMIGVGAVLGNYYAQEVNPVNIVDAPPDTLRQDYKTDYVLMVAEVYSLEQNTALAARQLALLGSAAPVEIINQALLFALDNGYPAQDLLLIRDLSLVMSTWNPDLEGSGP